MRLALLTMAMAVSLSVPAQDAIDKRVKVLSCRTPAQLEALKSAAPELAYLGRRFAGKSHVLCRKGLEYAVVYGNDDRYDSPRVAVCREERASMEATTLATMRDEILGHELWAALYKAGKDEIWIPNGAIIRFFGLDKPGRALGSRYAWMGVDQAEQLSNEQFNIAISCCTQPYFPWTQFFTSYNPENPEHWAFKRYRPDLGSGKRFDDRGHFADVVLVGEDDLLDILNPSDRDRLERLEGVWRDRLRYGRWVAFTGVCLHNWDPDIHLVSPPVSWAAWGGYPPPSWTRFRGIDFGYNPDPYCVLWAARSPETGALYVYRQEYRIQLTLDEQIHRVRMLDAAEREALLLAAESAPDDEDGEAMRSEARETLDIGLQITTYSDHQADARAMYKKGGINSKPAFKEVQAGIESVVNHLSPRQPGGPRLFVVKNSLTERDRKLEADDRPTCLEEEVGRYIWKTAKSAAGAVAIKDVPVDENNHAMDALRYLVHSLAVKKRFA